MKTLPEKQQSAAVYQIELKPAAECTLSKLPPKLQKLIATKINSFGKNPNFIRVEKLSGNKKIDQIPIVAYGKIYEVHNELPRHDTSPDWAPTQNRLQPLMLA
jgi:mRNA-degrading endonuclease RelE of RelBE toxin-antitoxin system